MWVSSRFGGQHDVSHSAGHRRSGGPDGFGGNSWHIDVGATAAIEKRDILKTYFENGEIPTQDQFAALIDSAVNVIGDRYLLGLRQYDPALVYRPGDTAIAVKRFGIGDTDARCAAGRRLCRPAHDADAFAPDFAGQFGFAALRPRRFHRPNLLWLRRSSTWIPSPSDGSPTAIQLQYIEFEDTPNTPMTAFAVPEPASPACSSSAAAYFAARLAQMTVMPL